MGGVFGARGGPERAIRGGLGSPAAGSRWRRAGRRARALEVLVELASLQTSFLTLDAAIKTTNRRVNALENVVKPRLENTIAYIRGELDEHEREGVLPPQEDPGVQAPEGGRGVLRRGEGRRGGRAQVWRLHGCLLITAGASAPPRGRCAQEGEHVQHRSK